MDNMKNKVYKYYSDLIGLSYPHRSLNKEKTRRSIDFTELFESVVAKKCYQFVIRMI